MIYYLITDQEVIDKLNELFPNEIIVTEKGCFIKEELYLIYESNKNIDFTDLEEKNSDLFLFVIWGENGSRISFIPHFANIVPLNGNVVSHLVQYAELQCDVKDVPKEIEIDNFVVRELPEEFINSLLNKE